MHQFRAASSTAAAAGTSDAVRSDEREASGVVELNDDTRAFEYTLYPLTDPPYVRLYVPGTSTPTDRPTDRRPADEY